MFKRLKKLCRQIFATVLRSSGSGDDINIVIILKSGELYTWIFNHANRSDALRSMGQFASEPDLDFDWADATECCEAVSMVCEQERRIKCQR